MNGADAIVKCLEAEQVEVVFGYPGVAICPFYNSILDSTVRTILIRTEQNAAHAASGMARIMFRKSSPSVRLRHAPPSATLGGLWECPMPTWTWSQKRSRRN